MKLKLIYDHRTAGKPILSEALLKTGVQVNILEARVTPVAGEILVDAQDSEEQLKRMVSLLQGEGVTVKELTQTLEIDKDKCISCEACISICPTNAIEQQPNWDMEFNEKKCVRCRICVDACPVRAIKII